MKCTVVIPAYNTEETIGACLAALVEQEGVTLNRDYTIILVNDGSTDSTLDIAKRFPIGIVNMRENSGRLAARLEGARIAMTSLILFVDSRVVMARNVVAHIVGLPANECFLYDIQEPEKHELDWFNRAFHLIRARYYTDSDGPRSTIDKSNFKRSRKGTTAILINRDIFIDINSRIDPNRISDDTLLFYHLVYVLNGKLRVSDKPLGKYHPRKKPSRILSWLFFRGSLFADFYLVKGGYYHTKFILLLLAICVCILLATSGYACAIFGALLCIHTATCVYFSHEFRDAIILLAVLPIICTVFGAGVLRYFWRRHFGRTQSVLSV